MALVFIVHFAALGAFFAADDFLWLAHGRWHDAASAWTGSWGLGTAYRPLARLSFVADARAFGMTAWPWHAENLALHAAAAVLLAGVARQAGFAWFQAGAAALLFAALPVAWENVDWISGRTGLLIVVFGLLCAVCWLKSLRGSTWWLAPAAACQGAALLCYEPAIVIPLALAAGALAMRLRWRDAVPGLAVLLCTDAVIWAARSMMLGTAGVMQQVPRAQIWPGMARNLAGIVLHGWGDFGAPAFCLAALVLAAGLTVGRTRRAVAALLLAAFILYLSFCTVAGVTERFFYAAGAPLVLALVAASTAFSGLRPALAVLVVLFAWRSHAQAEGVRQAGQINQAILAQIAALPEDGDALVFDAVPTHFGPYYLLWGGFETATSLVRPAPGIAARSEVVLSDPVTLRRVLSGPARFFVYNAQRASFDDMTRADWLARHPEASALR